MSQAWGHTYWDCRKPAPPVSLAEPEEGQGLAMLVENSTNWENAFSAKETRWSMELRTVVVAMMEVFLSHCSRPMQDFLKPVVNHQFSRKHDCGSLSGVGELSDELQEDCAGP